MDRLATAVRKVSAMAVVVATGTALVGCGGETGRQ